MHFRAIFAPLLVLCACENSQPTIFDQIGNDEGVWLSRSPLADEKTWARVSSLRCHPTRAELCGPAGCAVAKQKPKIRQSWEPATNKFSRCDADGCDTYDAQVSYSGIWTTLSFPGRAMFTRVTAKGDYYEVLTQMDLIYIYRGKCERR